MRILHVLDHSVPVHTAYSHRTLSLLRQQRALGWHTIQLTGPAQGKVETEDRNRYGLQFFRTPPCPDWVPPPLVAARIARRLAHAIRLTRPDILHAHPPFANALAALWAGWRGQAPVLVELHGGARRAADNYAARAAGGVVADSFALRADLLARGLAPERVSVIAPAVDLPHHPAAVGPELRRRLGSGPVIGYVGRFDERAGLHLLLAALAPLRRAYPGLRVLLAGTGAADARLSEAAGADGAIVLMEFCEPERIAEVIAASDLLVYPALPTRSLAVPRRPLEAMAHGALVLASDIRAHRELIDHGQNGILFEAESVASLTESLEALLAEPGCMQPLRDRARSFAARERSWETAARCYLPVYQRLLEGVMR